MSHDKFFGICKNKCLVEINANSVGAAAQDLSNIDNEVFAEKATEAGVGVGGGIVSEIVPIEKGGTGATTAEEARTNLNVAVADHTHTLEEVTGSSVLAIENGGTGATTAEEARTNLNVASVDHTHTLEEITGSSVLPIEKGGTGATTAEEAKINLGINSGSGTVLFSSESGTTDTTITLSDDISNYKYVEVYYKKSSIDYTATDTSTLYEAKQITNTALTELTYNTNYIGVSKAIVKGIGTTDISIEPCHYYSNQTFVDSGTATTNTGSKRSKYKYTASETKEKHILAISIIGNTYICKEAYFIETSNHTKTQYYINDFDNQGNEILGPYATTDNQETFTHKINTTVGVSGLMSIYAIVGYK